MRAVRCSSRLYSACELATTRPNTQRWPRLDQRYSSVCVRYHIRYWYHITAAAAAATRTQSRPPHTQWQTQPALTRHQPSPGLSCGPRRLHIRQSQARWNTDNRYRAKAMKDTHRAPMKQTRQSTRHTSIALQTQHARSHYRLHNAGARKSHQTNTTRTLLQSTSHHSSSEEWTDSSRAAYER